MYKRADAWHPDDVRLEGLVDALVGNCPDPMSTLLPASVAAPGASLLSTPLGVGIAVAATAVAGGLIGVGVGEMLFDDNTPAGTKIVYGDGSPTGGFLTPGLPEGSKIIYP